MSIFDDLVRGSIDIHVHFGPDPRVERRANAITLAQQAHALGMRGLVLKSHEYPTAPVASTISSIVPDVMLIGGICLDDEVGGLNPRAVEASANMGACVVWMPTYSSAADHKRVGESGGIELLDKRGRLVPQAQEILELVRAHDLVLATGHISTAESFALTDQAREMGISRVVITHASLMQKWQGMTIDDMKSLANKGAFIEHCINTIMPVGPGKILIDDMVTMIREVGAEHCIVSTDFGQDYSPMPPEGFRMGLAYLFKAGLSQEEIETMVKTNPSQLLGIH